MTTSQAHRKPAGAPPPPPPAEITYSGQYSVNPLAEVSFRQMSAALPSVRARIGRLSWQTDRQAVRLLIGCQVVTGASAAALLAATARAMGPVLGAGSAGDRLNGALPALLVVALAATMNRVSGAVATYAGRRITPLLTSETDSALVEAVCRVEASAYAGDGFSDRQEAAEMGVVRTHVMVTDAQRFMSSLIRLVTAGSVLSVLNVMMLPLLLLAVLPAGIGAVLTARVDYEIHYSNISDRNVRGMMRWWATASQYGDEVRANSMTDYLVYWYRALSDRCDQRNLAAAPRTLRISLLSALAGGVFLLAAWGALAWLAVTGRIEPAIAATAVIAVQTALAALSQVIINGAAIFHTSLYLTDMQSFLDEAAALTPQRGPREITGPVEQIRLDEVSYQYPGKDKPAVDGVSLTLERGQILAIVGANGSGKSTLTRLITGIYLSDKGRVTWNGSDLVDTDPASVWARTGLVPQEFAKWPWPVRENITLGQPHTHDDGPVWEAIDAVGLRKAVEDLPNELNSLQARDIWGGITFSGGEWQREACARALYRKPDLLILDEPTSQMDPRGEHLIFERIKAIAADRITIMVTHRPGEHEDRGPHHRAGRRPDLRAGPLRRSCPRWRDLRRAPGAFPGPLTGSTPPNPPPARPARRGGLVVPPPHHIRRPYVLPFGVRGPEREVRPMRQVKPLPAVVRGWVEQRIGPIVSVRDASHDWDRSRVWEVEGADGVRRYVKVSPSVKFFTREGRAYRHVVPALGHSRAPRLIDSRAEDLVLLLSAVPGAPAKELGLSASDWRAVHQQAGMLCARLHEVGELGRADRVEAEASLETAADGAERYLARAGDRLTVAEQHLVRDHAARLRRVGPVPVGYIHGDNQPRNWMVSDGVLALIDFERTRPAALVQDLVILTVTQWIDHPDRERAFLSSYGRTLSDAERHALRCLTALDAVNCLSWGPDNNDEVVTARGRRTLDRLMKESGS